MATLLNYSVFLSQSLEALDQSSDDDDNKILIAEELKKL
jgi:hypothetical protein